MFRVGDYVVIIDGARPISLHCNNAGFDPVRTYGWGTGRGLYNYVKAIEGEYAYIVSGWKIQSNRYLRVGKPAYAIKVELNNLRRLNQFDCEPLLREIDRLREIDAELITGRK